MLCMDDFVFPACLPDSACAGWLGHITVVNHLVVGGGMPRGNRWQRPEIHG